MSDSYTSGMKHTSCTVCGEVPEKRIPPEYVFPTDQSDVPDYKMNMVPFDGELSEPFVCSHGCLETWEEHNP